MEAKLRSVLRTPTLRSALEAFVFAGAVWWARFGALDLMHTLFLLVVTAGLYLRRPFGEAKTFIVSLFAVLGLVYVAPPFGTLEGEASFAVGMGTLFLLLIGIKETTFFRRKSWYYLFFFSLFLAGSVIFLDQVRESPFLEPLFFATLVFMYNEMYAVLTPVAERNRRFFISAATALASIEFLWIARFLPIGASDGAALATLFSYVFTNILVLHFRGTLTRSHIIRDVLLLATLSVFVFLFRSV